MDRNPTLTGFLEQTGAQLRFYDIGRRIAPIRRDDFLHVELAERPYPGPLRGQAWFALVQIHAGSEPLIWFLHFDLDEQGTLVLAGRDHFLHCFVELATHQTPPQAVEQALNESPYTFRPSDEKMANFHAILARDLGEAPSAHYRHAVDYFSGTLGWDQWRFLGLQGIADVAARLDQDRLADRLAAACPQLPREPLIALCHSLEHHRPGPELADALLARLDAELATGQAPPALVAALIRGLSQAPRTARDSALRQVLLDPASAHAEVLAAVGGRAWEALLDPDLAKHYLERLAGEPVAQEVFNQCLGDLLRVPGLRQPLLRVARDPARSENIARAFQALLAH